MLYFVVFFVYVKQLLLAEIFINIFLFDII